MDGHQAGHHKGIVQGLDDAIMAAGGIRGAQMAAGSAAQIKVVKRGPEPEACDIKSELESHRFKSGANNRAMPPPHTLTCDHTWRAA